MKIISRTVLLLSLVSLFTDVASEMLYPVIPIYLQSIHFSVLFIGLLEGVAEAMAGLTKGYFGKLSDNLGRRLPFVRLGYGLSALSKPMMALFAFPAWILSARTLDRLGKGIRTGARDALLAAEATPETKGRVFGFHRGMDTLGAVIGPATALAFLWFFPGRYVALFYIAFVPGIVSIACTFLVKEKAMPARPNKTRFLDFVRYWRSSPGAYRQLLAGLLLFALVNSSDMFLVLKIKSSGASDTFAIGIYIFYNLVYAIASYPLGGLGDRIGLKKVFVAGLFLFALVYIGMGSTGNIFVYVLLFLVYGLYAAATDGISKALISRNVAAQDTGVAIGAYAGFQSIAALFASTLAGLVWFGFGSAPLLIGTGIATGIIAIFFVVTVKEPALKLTSN